MRSIMVWVYECSEVFCAILMEAVGIVSLSRPILKKVLGGVGPTVNLGDIFDGLFLDFRFYGLGLPERIFERCFDRVGG